MFCAYNFDKLNEKLKCEYFLLLPFFISSNFILSRATKMQFSQMNELISRTIIVLVAPCFLMHVLFVLLNVFASFSPSSFSSFHILVSSWHVHFRIMERNGTNRRKNKKNNEEERECAPLNECARNIHTMQVVTGVVVNSSTSSPCELRNAKIEPHYKWNSLLNCSLYLALHLKATTIVEMNMHLCI